MESEVVLRVFDIARGGAGVARDASDRVVFIPYTAPGDLVRARIVETQKRYAHAELLEVLEPSPERQIPRCPIFGKCGGCQWQHISYDLQWKIKFKGALQALERAKVVPPVLCDPIPATQIWEYRNRVQLKGNGPLLGFFKPQSRELIAADRCDIARAEINQIWEDVRQEGQKSGSPYKVEVEVREDGSLSKIWNSPHAAGGFRQIHDQQNERLKEWIAEALEPKDRLYDLFGGAGNLSLSLLSKMKEIHCVDVSAPKQKSSEHSPHFFFHRESVLKWLSKQKKRAGRVQTSAAAILDPPREGLGDSFLEVASALERLGVTEVVSVGCDVDSWARDLSRWVGKGWRLERVAVIDLFPQTYHAEAIGLMRRP